MIINKLGFKSDVIKHCMSNFEITIKELLNYAINNKIYPKHVYGDKLHKKVQI